MLAALPQRVSVWSQQKWAVPLRGAALESACSHCACKYACVALPQRVSTRLADAVKSALTGLVSFSIQVRKLVICKSEAVAHAVWMVPALSRNSALARDWLVAGSTRAVKRP